MLRLIDSQSKIYHLSIVLTKVCQSAALNSNRIALIEQLRNRRGLINDQRLVASGHGLLCRIQRS